MLLGHVVRICNPFVENSSPYLITPLFSGQSEFLNQLWIRAILIRMRRSSLMSRKQYLVLIMFTTEKTAWLLCVEPNMVTFLTPVEGQLMQMALLSPHLLGDCICRGPAFICCSIFTVHFLFLHSMFVIVSCHQSLFIQFSDTVVCVSPFLFSPSLSSFSLSFHV